MQYAEGASDCLENLSHMDIPKQQEHSGILAIFTAIRRASSA
jgi:hypothetical protein